MTGFARDFTGRNVPNVVRYVMHCRECKGENPFLNDHLTFSSHPSSYSPFHRIGIDLLGRFQKSAHGNKWIIVCTDYSTRYAITKALPTAEVYEIAKFLLEEIVLRHGAPRVIITDRGAAFSIQTCFLSRRLVAENWDEILPFVTFAYNTAETTGFTPFYLLHGREAETTLDTMLPFCPNDFDDNNITKIAARAEESRQLAHSESSRQRSSTLRFQHQMVSLRSRRSRMDLYSTVTYEVQDFDPASRKRKLREVVHVLRMKPYHDPAEQIETEDIPPKESYKGPITQNKDP
ncbi:transposon Ty3-I Gag-Pol polyprotein [Trichonephila clavipes]|uniref:Transposon Ty3-I Gag-Pol polyprotein n=1 Tax=Trichonephila clavipes TaxID=2585209 RepID=A0A8X6S440_TRICX|nr:transposon Ty3-I Gag-Pol polyprotein [Trichonephila clavipes]